MKKVVLLALVVLFNVSCATMSDVIKSKPEGIARVYPVSEDQAWHIAFSVFRGEGAEAIEEHKADRYMVTSSGVGYFTWGTLMGVWLEPQDAFHTTVTVVTKRRMALNAVTALTESGFHQRFQRSIELSQTGKTLPIEPEKQ